MPKSLEDFAHSLHQHEATHSTDRRIARSMQSMQVAQRAVCAAVQMQCSGHVRTAAPCLQAHDQALSATYKGIHLGKGQ